MLIKGVAITQERCNNADECSAWATRKSLSADPGQGRKPPMAKGAGAHGPGNRPPEQETPERAVPECSIPPTMAWLADCPRAGPGTGGSRSRMDQPQLFQTSLLRRHLLYGDDSFGRVIASLIAYKSSHVAASADVGGTRVLLARIRGGGPTALPAAQHPREGRLIGELQELTGYLPTSLLRLLYLPDPTTASEPCGSQAEHEKPRHPRRYGSEVVEAPVMLGETCDGLCGKLLQTLLPPLVGSDANHRHLCLERGVATGAGANGQELGKPQRSRMAGSQPCGQGSCGRKRHRSQPPRSPRPKPVMVSRTNPVHAIPQAHTTAMGGQKQVLPSDNRMG